MSKCFFLGTILVTISFPFIFLKCLTGENAEDWAQLVYYAPFVAIFQIGWAATQIAHLALVNEIAFDESERVGLNSYRYSENFHFQMTFF